MQTANYSEVNHSISVLFFFHTAIKLFGSKFHENLTGKTICTRTGSLQTNKIIREFFRLVLSSALLMIWCFGHPTPLFFSSSSVECVSWYWIGRSDRKWQKHHKKSRNRRPGTPASLPWTWTQNQYGGKVGWCHCKIKTTWEKGSSAETLLLSLCPFFRWKKKTIQSEKMV